MDIRSRSLLSTLVYATAVLPIPARLRQTMFTCRIRSLLRSTRLHALPRSVPLRSQRGGEQPVAQGDFLERDAAGEPPGGLPCTSS